MKNPALIAAAAVGLVALVFTIAIASGGSPETEADEKNGDIAFAVEKFRESTPGQSFESGAIEEAILRTCQNGTASNQFELTEDIMVNVLGQVPNEQGTSSDIAPKGDIIGGLVTASSFYCPDDVNSVE